MKLVIKSFWPGVIWFILSCTAFFIPGNALPDDKWFSLLEVDKLVHVGLFAVMIVLWCLPLYHKSLSVSKWLIGIPVLFFVYSILVEYIQHYLIPGRSFDLADIVADGVGCMIGFLLMRRYHRTQVEAK
jgi:VanZ family protein